MSGFQMSLRSLSPALYEYIINQFLEQYHIHSYDIQVLGVKTETGIQVIVKYGETFSHESEQHFTFEALKNKDILNTFIQETGEACKKVMIDDYFRTMTP